MNMNEEDIERALAERYADLLYEPLKALLVSHGGNIEAYTTTWLYVFPRGTKRVENWPRVQNMRYTITFPDGFQLHQVMLRSGQVFIYFFLKDISQEIQTLYEATKSSTKGGESQPGL